MEKKTVWIPVITFLALIFGGMVWGILKPDQAYSDTENRYLASRPEFSWESLFPAAIRRTMRAISPINFRCGISGLA